MLREKNVSLSIELDKAHKRETETRHRLDELSTIHASEAVRLSELLAALGKSEKEEMRLQKSFEMAQTKLSEMTEAARFMESDTQAELTRNHLEMDGLRSEIQNLQSRLELASNESSAAAAEMATLRAQWSDAVAEKQVADEKLSALMKESESDKMSLSAVNANYSVTYWMLIAAHAQLGRINEARQWLENATGLQESVRRRLEAIAKP